MCQEWDGENINQKQRKHTPIHVPRKFLNINADKEFRERERERERASSETIGCFANDKIAKKYMNYSFESMSRIYYVRKRDLENNDRYPFFQRRSNVIEIKNNDYAMPY
ncbi:unnamed protein product [Xylocopa violacea]|uniref:Ycf1 n=1 Tax=Xylocopa violacea TaxID=135666 RepID=A0ABP1P0I8_XYLVO